MPADHYRRPDDYNLLMAVLLIDKAAALSDPLDRGGIRRTLDRAKMHLALATDSPDPAAGIDLDRELARLIADSRPAEPEHGSDPHDSQPGR